MPGIYQIISPSGGFYIGSAVDIPARWRSHRHLLRHGKHHSPALQRAHNKYGAKAIVFNNLIICRRCDLRFFEQRAIDAMKPQYNVRKDARATSTKTSTENGRSKQSAAMLGRKIHSDEHKKNLSQRMKGNKFGSGRRMSQDHRINFRAAGVAANLRKAFERRATDMTQAQMARDYVGEMDLLTLSRKYKIDHRTARRMLVNLGVVIRPRGVTLASQRRLT